MEALMQAVGKGEEGTVMRLLDEDPALLEGVGYDGHRPLTRAAMRGRLNVVKLLLQRGADADTAGRHGATALHYAAKGGWVEIAIFLLSNGADAKARDTYGKIPLMSACWKGHVGVVRVLLQHTGAEGLETRDGDGKTALHLAAMKGQLETTALLLGQGADVNAVADTKRTPLMLACMGGHVGLVRVLLQHVGEEGLQATDWERKTALHLAAKSGYGEIVRLLLFAGADPAVKDEKRRTPRALAAYWGKAECVAFFKWWEGELARRYALFRATCLNRASAIRRDKPTPGVPTFLDARLPSVEVVSLPSHGRQKKDDAGASGKRKAAGERGDAQGAEAGEEGRHAVLSYVLKALNEELLVELLEGFHS